MTIPTQEPSPAKSPAPALIPSGDVVILREGDLDTDLATAIHRVRTDSKTSRSRILIVGADADDTVDHDPVASESLPVPRMPVTSDQLGRLQERSVLEALGARFGRLVESLAMLEGEIASMTAGLCQEVVEAPRAHIQSGVARIGDALDWTRAILDEFSVECERLELGMRACDAAEAVREAARQVETYFPNVRVRVGGESPPPVVARSSEIVEAMFAALVVVAHRIGGTGPIHVTLAGDEGFVSISMLGLGEPQTVEAQELIVRVREIVQSHGGQIRPTEHGEHGTGVQIRLPSA